MLAGGKAIRYLCLAAWCLALPLSVSAKDRYFSWVDEHGQLRTTIIHEPDQPNPLEQQAEKHQQAEKGEAAAAPSAGQEGPSNPSKTPASAASSAGKASPASPQTTPSDSAATAAENTPASERATTGSAKTVSPVPSASSGQPASSSSKATISPSVGVATASKEKAASSSKAGGNDGEFNLKNYPDGDTLAKHGFVRDENHRPYFTWLDAQHNLRSTFYQPPPFKDNRVPPGKGIDGVAFNRANVLSYAAPASGAELPKAAAPDVASVLGLNRPPKLLQAFADRCCGVLQKGDIADLPPDRDFPVNVVDGDPVYDFSTGKSRYRWVKLPADGAPYALRLRSFIHNGVFIPTLVFFDSQFRITRLITDISFDYAPERWYRYGYLQAVFPVYPAKGGERWLLVLTRKQDLHQKTVVDQEDQTPPITHTATGSLELAVVDKP